MSEHEDSLENRPADKGKTFSWNFSFGTDPEKLREAIEAARAEGIEPEIKEFSWKWNSPSAQDHSFENHDPLRTVRTVLSWLPGLIFLALFAGGVFVGFQDRTVGPIWGGIMGAILGGFFYTMMRSSGRRW